MNLHFGFGAWREKFAALLDRSPDHDSLAKEMEALLYEADFSSLWVERLMKVVERGKRSTHIEIREALEKVILEALHVYSPFREDFPLPYSILLVGVNGAGKTTISGKLAQRYCNQGKHVVLAAADTFRAGAVEQLAIWAKRSGAEIVVKSPGSDPAAVVYEAWQKAIQKNAILIADTAGRLHTKVPLLEQLKKIIRAIGKDEKAAPHEIFLVLDGTMGQNALHQSREFSKAASLTGLVVTKMDGSAKGGAALSASLELSIPIRYLGVGEGADDVALFDPKTFSRELFYT